MTDPKEPECDHGIAFDVDAAKSMTVAEIRKTFPRHFGKCAKCGWEGIYYASYSHYVYGDW